MPQILWRKLSRMALEPRNLRKFSPSKFSAIRYLAKRAKSEERWGNFRSVGVGVISEKKCLCKECGDQIGEWAYFQENTVLSVANNITRHQITSLY